MIDSETIAAGDKPKVLVVNESPAYIRMVQLELRASGFTVEGCQVQDVLEAVERVRPVAITLDVQLPAAAGLSLLQELLDRYPRTPIIVVSSLSTDADRALILDMGAADFVVKPFDPSDLSLRINSALRRPFDEVHKTIQVGGVEVDVAHRIVRKGGNVLPLTLNEWALLLALIDADGVMTVDDLLHTVFEDDLPGSPDVVRFWIRRLRSHIEDDPEHPRLVVGDTDSGFRLRVD